MNEVRAVLENTPGVQRVLGPTEKYLNGLQHERSGDLIAIADAQSWFTYYFWNDDRLAPDFATCVDIHKKCGYDPVELFLNPRLTLPKLQIAGKLAKKMLGLRMTMDVIPLDATLVKGSHGRVPEDAQDWPVLIGDFQNLPRSGRVGAHEVYHLLLEHCSAGSGYHSPSL
jgi:hypothetical protein